MVAIATFAPLSATVAAIVAGEGGTVPKVLLEVAS